jgi:hypothetical protein
MQKSMLGSIVATAVAGLFVASSALADKAPAKPANAGGAKHCTEKNACKGKGSCKGEAGGKKNECKGKNECKNHVLEVSDEAACKKAGGEMK